jgi:hypothetical protein
LARGGVKVAKPLEIIKVDERLAETFSIACELVKESQKELAPMIRIKKLEITPRFVTSLVWAILISGVAFGFLIVYHKEQPLLAWVAGLSLTAIPVIEIAMGIVSLRRTLRRNTQIREARARFTSYDMFLVKLYEKIQECNRDIENFNNTYAKMERMPSWQRSIVAMIREDIESSSQVYDEFLRSLSFFAPQRNREDILRMVNDDPCNAFVSCLAALLKDI